MINLDTVGSKDKEKTIKSLLKLYRTILHIVNNGLVLLNDEMYVTSRKHLSDIIEGLMPFETKKDEQDFYDKVSIYHTDLEILHLLENVCVMVKSYPDNGNTYYKILEMLYFNSFDYDSDEIMSILEISRSTYYRNLKKAYLCYYYHLIGVLRSKNKNFCERELVEKFC